MGQEASDKQQAASGRGQVESCILHPAPCTLLLAFSILLGFGLRLILLNSFPLREDEAIYGYWALHFLHEDPWFLHVWPDKPPLFLWALSAVFSLLGESAAAGRLLNIAISTLTIPVVGITAHQLWGNRAGLVASLAMALSPFAISFAATLFTDPLLVFAGSLAFYFALTERTFWAGVWLAVAIMTKQQGLLYVPLIAGVIFGDKRVGRWGDGEETVSDISPSPHLPISLSYFLLGLLLIILPILLWDSQRWSVAPSPWDWSMRNYAPLRFVPIGEWIARGEQWGSLLWLLAANWLLWALLLVALLVALVGQLIKISITPSSHHPFTFSPFHLFIIWTLAFVALHITTTLQIWDRYLLPLAPWVALGIGWIGKDWKSNSVSALQSLIPAIVLLTMLIPAWTAATGRLPVGGDHGAYSGFEEMLSALKSATGAQFDMNTRSTPRTTSVILYHRTLGWHYQFYLYDSVHKGEVALHWYPDSVYLADNAAKSPHRRKFLIQPNWSPTEDLSFFLQIRGLQLKRLSQNKNFTLLEIVQPPRPFCNWCFSTVHRPFPTLTGIAAPAMICE